MFFRNNQGTHNVVKYLYVCKCFIVVLMLMVSYGNVVANSEDGKKEEKYQEGSAESDSLYTYKERLERLELEVKKMAELQRQLSEKVQNNIFETKKTALLTANAIEATEQSIQVLRNSDQIFLKYYEALAGLLEKSKCTCINRQ